MVLSQNNSNFEVDQRMKLIFVEVKLWEKPIHQVSMNCQFILRTITTYANG